MCFPSLRLMVLPLVEWINVKETVLVDRDEDEEEENYLVGHCVVYRSNWGEQNCT